MRAEDLKAIDGMPFLFWIKDEQGKYLWVNRALAELAAQEMVGKTDLDMPWSNMAEEYRLADRQVFESNKPIFVHEYIDKPLNITHNVCKFPGTFDGQRCVFGVALPIDG